MIRTYVDKNNKEFNKNCISALKEKDNWYCKRYPNSMNLDCIECNKFRIKPKN